MSDMQAVRRRVTLGVGNIHVEFPASDQQIHELAEQIGGIIHMLKHVIQDDQVEFALTNYKLVRRDSDR